MLTLPFILMLSALAVLLAFHLVFFRHVAFYKGDAPMDRDMPLSVVICAKNEASSLESLLPMLLDQSHNAFEVVVVNDRSDDGTDDILRWKSKEDPRVRVVNISARQDTGAGKKMALWLGIREAKHPKIVVTDADCTPLSKDWLALIAGAFAQGKDVVIGHSPYTRKPGGTNLIERFENTMKAMQYLGFARAGLPYMGVGRNMAFSKDLYLENRAQVKGRHIMSGDDDLFVNHVATGANTIALLDPRSFVETRPTRDMGMWLRRKRRHYTTAIHYRSHHQLLLILLPLARFIFWVALIWLAVLGEFWQALGGSVAGLALLLPIKVMSARKLDAAEVVPWIQPLEWLFLLLDPMIYFSTLISKPTQWK